MSDVMLFGVLRMPYDMAMGDELSRYQYHQRGIEAANTIESLQARIAGLEADAARYRWLTEDHADTVTRSRCRDLLDRMSVMSYSAACADIDAAMKG